MRAGLSGQEGTQCLPVPVVGVQIHKYHRPRTALQNTSAESLNYSPVTKAHNIMLSTVLYVSTHTNEPRKSPITLKYLTAVLAKAPSITPPHLKNTLFCCMDIFGLNMFFKYSVGVLVKQRIESHVIASKCTKNEVLLLQWGLSAVHFNSSERAEAPGFALTY